jgi:hypothetical protein
MERMTAFKVMKRHARHRNGGMTHPFLRQRLSKETRSSRIPTIRITHGYEIGGKNAQDYDRERVCSDNF